MNKIPLFDGANAEVESLTAEEANKLVSERIAVPVGRRTLRGLRLITDVSAARAIIRGTSIPISQGSRTVVRVRVLDGHIYEHHMRRCEAFGVAAVPTA